MSFNTFGVHPIPNPEHPIPDTATFTAESLLNTQHISLIQLLS